MCESVLACVCVSEWVCVKCDRVTALCGVEKKAILAEKTKLNSFYVCGVCVMTGTLICGKTKRNTRSQLRCLPVK